MLIFRRIQLYTCGIWYCHSLREFVVACRYTTWVSTQVVYRQATTNSDRLSADSARRDLARTANTQVEIRHSGLYTEITGRCSKGLKEWGRIKIIYVHNWRVFQMGTSGAVHNHSATLRATLRAYLGAATDSRDIRWHIIEPTRHSSFFELKMAEVFKTLDTHWFRILFLIPLRPYSHTVTLDLLIRGKSCTQWSKFINDTTVMH